MRCLHFPPLVVLLLTVLVAPAGAEGPAPTSEKAAAPAEEAIDFNYARGLFRKRQAGEALTAEEAAYLERALAARRAGNRPAAGRPGGAQRQLPVGASTGLKPLLDMTAEDRYLGEDGGLYGEGSNRPDEVLQRAAEVALARIEPLDAAGRPAETGRIVLLSISMSNATQEFSVFKRLADAHEGKNPHVTIVDGAQGGQAMAEWADPNARAWQVAQQRIRQADVTAEQVQAAWVKLANKGPRGEYAEHGEQLKRDTYEVIRLAAKQFPNLRIVYLASRTYGGYGPGNLNPEPYAYESGLAARAVVREQFSRDGDKLPVIVWGAYLWADGEKPRSDGLTWMRDDFGGDGVHPSISGREKVAKLLLTFFTRDPLAAPWFAASSHAPR